VRLIWTSLLFAFGLSAQVQYVVQKTTALSGAVEGITIQQPASAAQNVKFIAVYIDCSAACTLTLTRDGAAATTTALTVNNLNPGEKAAAVTAFSSSNVGAGTTIGVYTLGAAGTICLDLSGITFRSTNGTGSNLTIKTNSITATVNIVFRLTENGIM
jgi:hypothetical protein